MSRRRQVRADQWGFTGLGPPAPVGRGQVGSCPACSGCATMPTTASSRTRTPRESQAWILPIRALRATGLDSPSYLWDKVGSTYIAHSPSGFRPLTANEMRIRGEDPPAADGIPTGRVEAAPPPSPSGLMDYPRDAASMREQSTTDRLRELQRLHREGLITDEEYEEQRAQIMDEL